MRHSYRSWLDAVGTPLAVQQKLMRRHPNHDECVRRCGDGWDGRSEWKNHPVSHQWQV